MTKTILALVAAGVLGAAMVPTGANAMVPSTTAKMTAPSKVSETKLNRERTMLRRDVRLHRTVAATRLRREINADERAVNRAKSGGMQNPTARPMQSTQAPTPQPPSSTQNSTTPQQNTTNK
ncbi:MAG TPA: hypothetical protein VG308_17900 [Stellaceae bacterium]|jgi:hypothetical protein|nr:hypothetical protein [Stellaceae bacterium]